jgi:hypothetical protein
MRVWPPLARARSSRAPRHRLRPGGSFLIDTFGVFVLARGFRAQAWEQLEDGRLWLEQRSYDQLTGRTQAA